MFRQRNVPARLQATMKTALLVLTCAVFLSNAQAQEKGAQVQRKAIGLFDNQASTAGNANMFVSNYGILGLDIARSQTGNVWPKGSNTTFIFGGGFWFGAKKRVEQNMSKFVTVGYNPNSGNSWFAPGRTEDGDGLLPTAEALAKYRVYVSSDFDEMGQPLDSEDGPAWPLWNTDQEQIALWNGTTGNYVHASAQRNSAAQSAGPVFIADEDILCHYKDTDLNLYEGSIQTNRAAGAPLGLQFEQAVYFWNNSFLKDVIIIRLDVHNTSNDTLFDCWIGPAMDPDLSNILDGRAGADNDNTRNYEEDESLDLQVLWSNVGAAEASLKNGYMGVNFLETPAVDGEGYLREDKNAYDRSEQLGLTSSRSWIIANDPSTPDERYDFMSGQAIDPGLGNKDVRLLMASGPFHLLPGQKTRLVIGVLFAYPAVHDQPDGSTADVADVVSLAKNVQDFYYNGAISSVGGKGAASASLQVLAANEPGNGQIRFRVATEQAGELRIEVRNALGQRVLPDIRRFVPAGESAFGQLCDNLTSGAYYYRCSLGNASAQGAFAILR